MIKLPFYVPWTIGFTSSLWYFRSRFTSMNLGLKGKEWGKYMHTTLIFINERCVLVMCRSERRLRSDRINVNIIEEAVFRTFTRRQVTLKVWGTHPPELAHGILLYFKIWDRSLRKSGQLSKKGTISHGDRGKNSEFNSNPSKCDRTPISHVFRITMSGCRRQLNPNSKVRAIGVRQTSFS